MGSALQGKVRLGLIRLVMAGYGLARFGVAMRGDVRSGKVWQVMAMQGNAGQGAK